MSFLMLWASKSGTLCEWDQRGADFRPFSLFSSLSSLSMISVTRFGAWAARLDLQQSR
jgi:hypothetical protein